MKIELKVPDGYRPGQSNVVPSLLFDGGDVSFVRSTQIVLEAGSPCYILIEAIVKPLHGEPLSLYPTGDRIRKLQADGWYLEIQPGELPIARKKFYFTSLTLEGTV